MVPLLMMMTPPQLLPSCPNQYQDEYRRQKAITRGSYKHVKMNQLGQKAEYMPPLTAGKEDRAGLRLGKVRS